MATKKTRSKPKTKAAKQAVKAAKTVKLVQKPGRGRPTKYMPAYNELARKAALLGMTDVETAEFLGVAESTLHLWKLEHPKFSESLYAGKERADAEVAAALYSTATGGLTVTEIREEPDAEGNIVTKRVIRELPPDVRAQKFWLINRRPADFREKVVTEDATPPETLAATAGMFEEIMARARARQRQVLIDRGILKPDDKA